MQTKKFGIILLFALALSILSIFLYFLWKWRYYVTTDAVFVQADRLVYLSFPKVQGKIVRLYKVEGDKVEKGEVLAEIEGADYLAKMRSLEESLSKISFEREGLSYTKLKLEKEIPLRSEQIEKEIRGLEEQKRAQKAKIEALRVKLAFVKKERQRVESLYKEGLIPLQNLEGKETEERELQFKLEAEEAQLRAIEEKIKSLQKELSLIQNEKLTVKNLGAQISALFSQEKALAEQVQEMRFLLANTKLISPLSGYIAKKFRSEGDVVSPGEPVYALVDPESFYVLVLLEETKLKGVEKGAKAKIKLDAYPGKLWKGEVQEILPASAATFALVPRDISAGEFTKLAQRIPVKIKILEGDRSLLRVGLSGEVEITKVRK